MGAENEPEIVKTRSGDPEHISLVIPRVMEELRTGNKLALAGEPQKDEIPDDVA